MAFAFLVACAHKTRDCEDYSLARDDIRVVGIQEVVPSTSGFEIVDDASTN